jgi:hypothetical protein
MRPPPHWRNGFPSSVHHVIALRGGEHGRNSASRSLVQPLPCPHSLGAVLLGGGGGSSQGSDALSLMPFPGVTSQVFWECFRRGMEAFHGTRESQYSVKRLAGLLRQHATSGNTHGVSDPAA